MRLLAFKRYERAAWAALFVYAVVLAGCAQGPAPAATGFIVAAAHPMAVDAGYQVLERGGSAVDAAIAVQAMLGLVEPEASGIGGGAFLLHWSQRERKLRSYDGRETAPAAATADRFLDARGKPLPFMEAVVGGRSVGVPGVLRMLELAHGRHGRLAWAELLAGSWGSADALLTESLQLAGRNDDRSWQILFAALRAWLLREAGAPEAARALAQQAVHASRTIDMPLGELLAQTELGLEAEAGNSRLQAARPESRTIACEAPVEARHCRGDGLLDPSRLCQKCGFIGIAWNPLARSSRTRPRSKITLSATPRSASSSWRARSPSRPGVSARSSTSRPPRTAFVGSPTPTIAPVIVCVVETGTPVRVT